MVSVTFAADVAALLKVSVVEPALTVDATVVFAGIPVPETGAPAGIYGNAGRGNTAVWNTLLGLLDL